jgi:hypothetical protein
LGKGDGIGLVREKCFYNKELDIIVNYLICFNSTTVCFYWHISKSVVCTAGFPAYQILVLIGADGFSFLIAICGKVGQFIRSGKLQPCKSTNNTHTMKGALTIQGATVEWSVVFATVKICWQN